MNQLGPLPVKEAKPYKTKLEFAKRIIMKENLLGEFRGSTVTAQTPGDVADASALESASEMLGILSENQGETLKQIDAALERITEKTYGECLSCTNRITKPRLEALPHTPYCIECQRELEAGRLIVQEKVEKIIPSFSDENNEDEDAVAIDTIQPTRE